MFHVKHLFCKPAVEHGLLAVGLAFDALAIARTPKILMELA